MSRGVGPDAFEVASLLFLRVLLRDSTEAPRFLVAPAAGRSWVVAVHIGEPPPELRALYERRAPAPAVAGASWRLACAPSAELALDTLIEGLREQLRIRLLDDAVTWERCFGVPFRVRTPRSKRRPSATLSKVG